MKVTDLTHSMYSDMPVFPGTKQPIFERVEDKRDGSCVFKICIVKVIKKSSV